MKKAKFKYPNEEARKVQEGYEANSPDSLWGFLQGLVIPSDAGPRLFRLCMTDFQSDAFTDMIPSLHAVRDGGMPPKRRFWLERTKKASKDGDLGALLMWLVAFPHKPIYMQVGAADRDQASIIKSRIKDLLHYNEWLNEFVEIQSWKVRNKKGLAELDILAADIGGSHGATPDVLVMNELSHVTKWEFLENLMDNATGVPRGVVIVATNAGFKGTPADVWRQNAVKSDDWAVHIWDKPSPWLNEADIQDARRRNTKSRYMRLYHGKWASGKGDAFDEDDIDAIFRNDLTPLQEPETGWRYIAGLDLGVSHDHAGLVLLGIHVAGKRMRLARMEAWEPPDSGEINLQQVESTVLATCKRFRADLHFDPWQAKLMAQRIKSNGVRTVEMNFTGSKLSLMANTLKEVVENHQLEAFDDEGRLRRDLGKLCLVEKPYGYKLEATSDEFGHADVGTALAICLPRAVEMLEGYAGLGPDDDVAELDDSPLTAEELDAMPDELRDIYDLGVEAEQEAKRAALWSEYPE
jgi:hypothetical protein